MKTKEGRNGDRVIGRRGDEEIEKKDAGMR
jgi:hypothetical protein